LQPFSSEEMIMSPVEQGLLNKSKTVGE